MKRHRLILIIVVVLFWPLVILSFKCSNSIFGTHPSLVLSSLRDRIAHDFTLDELRHFAHDVNQSGIISKDWINHGEISGLTNEQKNTFAQIKNKYSFMHWMDDGGICHGPSILNYGKQGVVDFEWGGALPGHWGCSISIDGTKNDSNLGPDSTVLHLSDDIYLYYGE